MSKHIIGCASRGINTLGPGFLEKVYENTLAHELRKAGLSVAQQHGTVVYYDVIIVGQFRIDLLIEATVTTELKTTSLPLCLLLNFGKSRLPIRRLVNIPWSCSICVHLWPQLLTCLHHPATAAEAPYRSPNTPAPQLDTTPAQWSPSARPRVGPASTPPAGSRA
jgi:hypothetical protein